ncbi:CPBP family intramembrane glutamic endopeptidase [Natrialbaceae archaeon AArc-T1-2]|uniref:CPBP family intramembrane glutamic endopeptidase n=1 Tax=Natrialbaceae archaeon AArc-T1-2 TaxID=3053904 RepID=UPI00255AA4AE|nr:CPBP family intramembrane glutamic endopeptidase [Natrialbaceae archaeon AArc-T1-2]WIV66012.1 CPBP family intramembrane metalloprotease [Natrialbaceae archaeon AArc-T1-2]
MALPQRRDSPARSALVGFGLALFGLFVATVLTSPLAFLDPGLADPDVSADRWSVITMMALNFGGFFLAGAIYLAYTGRGWSYVDLRLPTKRDLLWIVGTTVGSILFIIAFGIVVQLLELPSAPNEIVTVVGDDQVLLLAMFAIVVFANAPAEEFLFRNVIQKRLYEGYSTGVAIVLASVIFTVVHFPAFLTGGGPMLATLVSLTAIFVGSLIFGYAYAKTDNLVVPTAAHAGFNLFQFGLLYLQLEYGDPEELEEMQTALLEALLALTPV